MEKDMKATGTMIKWMAVESILGRMAANSMAASKLGRWMVMDFSFGRTEGNMEVTIRLARVLED